MAVTCRAVTRRATLAGAAAVALVACTSPRPRDTTPPAPPPPALDGEFTSAARLGKAVRWQVLTPSGHAADGLPVVVYLHGKGGDHTMVDYWAHGLDTFVAAGGAPLALAGVDAGNTYYHPRASGEDAGAMVLEEFVPLLGERGLDVGRLAFAGISMGGYGALRLAALHPGTRAVAVASPALWEADDAYAPGAFDSAKDHAEHNVFGHQGDLAGLPVRVDCGLSDPFIGATKAYVKGFPSPPVGEFADGGHDVGYWRTLVPAQLALLAPALA